MVITQIARKGKAYQSIADDESISCHHAQPTINVQSVRNLRCKEGNRQKRREPVTTVAPAGVSFRECVLRSEPCARPLCDICSNTRAAAVIAINSGSSMKDVARRFGVTVMTLRRHGLKRKKLSVRKRKIQRAPSNWGKIIYGGGT
jgi:hypothetical protein